MIIKGVVKGNFIELLEPIDIPDGLEVLNLNYIFSIP